MFVPECRAGAITSSSLPILRRRPIERFEQLADAAELVVIHDTSVFAQLDGLDAALTARQEKVVVIRSSRHRRPDRQCDVERTGLPQPPASWSRS
jgi:hypothetical protein